MFGDNLSSDNGMMRGLFGSVVERAFMQTLGVYESQVVDYLADILSDFAHVSQLHKIKDLHGRPLHEVADMLIQGDVQWEAYSFNREREVHKHIGDFTLFWAGVYPDALPRMHDTWRKDHLLDYVEQGKSSYAIAASFNYGDYQQEAAVLKRLSDEFDVCLDGLHEVRRQLDQMSHGKMIN